MTRENVQDPVERRQQPASPSPPPNPPAASAPGIRAVSLQEAFDAALAATFKACSYANFAKCFPTPATYVPEALDGLHRDFITRLNEGCKNEFAALVEERAVTRALNELDALVFAAKKRKDRNQVLQSLSQNAAHEQTVPPHLLDPAALLAAHLTPFLRSQAKNMYEQLDNYEKHNVDLAGELESQRTEIESLVNGLEFLVADLDQAATEMTDACTG